MAHRVFGKEVCLKLTNLKTGVKFTYFWKLLLLKQPDETDECWKNTFYWLYRRHMSCQSGTRKGSLDTEESTASDASGSSDPWTINWLLNKHVKLTLNLSFDKICSKISRTRFRRSMSLTKSSVGIGRASFWSAILDRSSSVSDASRWILFAYGFPKLSLASEIRRFGFLPGRFTPREGVSRLDILTLRRWAN